MSEEPTASSAEGTNESAKMNRVLARSVFDAFDYVMDHHCPPGCEQRRVRQDTYAAISIQDSCNDGFGFALCENAFCKGALTLLFDDIEHEVRGSVLFSADQAKQVVDFIADMRNTAQTLLVHCYAGKSRSRAIAAVAAKMLGLDAAPFLDAGANTHVYTMLRRTWKAAHAAAEKASASHDQQAAAASKNTAPKAYGRHPSS